MKSAIAYSIAATLLALSCTRTLPEEAERVPVRLSLHSTATRSGPDNFGADGNADRATVYVMDPSASDSSIPGDVVDIATFSTVDNGELELITSMGQKFFFIVLNGPAAGNPADYNAVKALQAGMPSGRGSGPLMTGLSARTGVNTAMQSIPITVNRQVFRVNITNITNNLPQNCNLTILYAYLSNYVSGYTLGNGNTPSVSYGNSRGRNGNGIINGTSVCADNDYTAISRAMSIGSGDVCTDYSGIGLYAFPNPCTTDSWGAGSSAARKTRVVLVASINGSLCYYPIPLDPQNSNCSYDMDISIYNTGTTDPETELAKGTVSISMTVCDWNVSSRTSNL